MAPVSFATRCSACGAFSDAGKGYWHLMRCAPWLLLHHPVRDEDGEVIEPRTIDHPLGLTL